MATEYRVFTPKNQRDAWKEFGVGRTMYGVRHHGKNVGGHWANEDSYPIEALKAELPINPEKPEVWIYVREV